jgi:hypothetical protein
VVIGSFSAVRESGFAGAQPAPAFNPSFYRFRGRRKRFDAGRPWKNGPGKKNSAATAPVAMALNRAAIGINRSWRWVANRDRWRTGEREKRFRCANWYLDSIVVLEHAAC